MCFAGMKLAQKQQGKDWKDGGWSEGDFHVWVKNDQTGEIIDPYFKEHKGLCAVNRLDINQPVYRPWRNQSKLLDERLGKYMPHIPEVVQHFAVPKYRCCAQNALAWINAKPERQETHSIVIGSMGWKNKYEPGYWFEWG